MNDKDRPVVIFIPNNYKTGFNVFGFEIKLFNVIQALILFAIPFLFSYLVLPEYFNISRANTYLFSTTLFFAAGFGYLGLVGINNMTLGEFLLNAMEFKRKQRNTFYNPRVKREIVNVFVEEDLREELPRDKIIAMYNEYKEKMDAKNREAVIKTIEEVNSVGENIFFEDDNGFVVKPIEYMTPKEYKQYKKKLAKEEKMAKKAQKKAEKEALKQEKMKNNVKKGKGVVKDEVK